MKFALLLFAVLSCFAQNYDLIIRNGHVIDGTGSPWYAADIAIRDGHIAAIGHLDVSQRQADHRRGRHGGGSGLYRHAGAIRRFDPGESASAVENLSRHHHRDYGRRRIGRAADRCHSQRPTASTYEHYKIDPSWNTFREFFARLEKQGMGINLASYVGATQVRRAVIGDGDRAPTAAELEQMKALVRDAMHDGAVGVSTSLQYAPAPYATTEELIALAAEGAKLGGIYATHMRSEGDAIIPAIDEAIRIGREAHIPVEIWHLKAAGRQNWGRMPEIVAHIDEARRSGVEIAANTYAYTAWFNSFSAFIPPWAHDGGDAKLIERLKDPAMRARIRKEMQTPSTTWDNEWTKSQARKRSWSAWCRIPSCCPCKARPSRRSRSCGRRIPSTLSSTC